jgi:hypothetical protein
MIHKKWMLMDLVKNFIPIFIIGFLCSWTIGCVIQPGSDKPFEREKTSNANITRLNKLKIGMTKDEVLALMGTPSKLETPETDEGISVEVLFYLTSFNYSTDMGWQNVDYTPLVLERGILKGWGKNYYEQRLPSPKTPKDQK